ncbi:hypothetical protein [Rarobacter faecitabidus]|nr:hypothetical protein [Rarobacter faecitabidus]
MSGRHDSQQRTEEHQCCGSCNSQHEAPSTRQITDDATPDTVTTP